MGAYNIYCDESCHLENDGKDVMVLGAVWCLRDNKQTIFKEIRAIKSKHSLPENFEVKWTKVSPAKVDFYKDLVRYFFENNELHFRAVIAQGKCRLDHTAYEQNHDDWYYKMYFDMLKVVLEPQSDYKVYLDIKDTCSAAKIRKLHDVLRNSMFDFNSEIVKDVQAVRSHEVELIQLTDLLIGAVSYVNRGIGDSEAKKEIISFIQKQSGYSLQRTTLFKEDKFNLLAWEPQERN